MPGPVGDGVAQPARRQGGDGVASPRLPVPWDGCLATAVGAFAMPMTQALIAMAIGDLHRGRLIHLAIDGTMIESPAWSISCLVVALAVLRGCVQIIAAWRWTTAIAHAGGRRMAMVRDGLDQDAGPIQGDATTSAFDRWIESRFSRQRLLSEMPAMGASALLVVAWFAPALAVIAILLWSLTAWCCVRAYRHEVSTAGMHEAMGRRWGDFLRDEAIATRSVRALRLESARERALDILQKTWASMQTRGRQIRESSLMPVHLLLAVGQTAFALVGTMLVLHGRLDVGGLIATLVVTTSVALRLDQVSGSLLQIAKVGTSMPPAGDPPADPVVPAPRAMVVRPDLALRLEITGSSDLMVAVATLHAGEILGVVGRDSEGKARFAKAWTGRVNDPHFHCCFGGDLHGWHEVATLSPDDQARLVQTVTGGSRLLSGSIASNLRLGQAGLDDDALHEALRLAGIDEPIRTMPGCLDLDLGERATHLSGGQRQRLCLARAIAARPRFLCLDGGTSELDPANEERILSGLREMARHPQRPVGILMVTTSPVLLAGCDRVLMVDGAQVVGEGTHADLGRQSPWYAALLGQALANERVAVDFTRPGRCA